MVVFQKIATNRGRKSDTELVHSQQEKKGHEDNDNVIIDIQINEIWQWNSDKTSHIR
jgi:ribose 5-phosphate isomerase